MLLLFRDLGSSSYRHALFCEGDKKFWLTSEKADSDSKNKNAVRIAAAVAGGMSLGLNTRDSVVLGMSAFNNFTRGAIGGIGPRDIPWINGSAEDGELLFEFPPLEKAERVYPIVDSSEWVERLVSLGVKTLQLRIKELTGSDLEDEIKKSIEIAREASARLFINDYWELALKHSAYGVHLGQDDLQTADLRAIERAGLRLGVSTHCYYEAAVAHGLRPSYIAFGPVYHTELKSMDFAPQGIDNLKTLRSIFDCPLVAIGGITLERVSEVMKGKPDYISVVRDITLSKNPEARIKSWLKISKPK
jgi:hydroxymethylpyrimidine kinase/phosphomethylpyrimidine kinase/thiamine-phosphate diphosphorylase